MFVVFFSFLSVRFLFQNVFKKSKKLNVFFCKDVNDVELRGENSGFKRTNSSM